jgi:hypothetical protein
VTDNFGEFQLSYRHGAITIPYIEWQEPLRLECTDFVQSIRAGRRPLTDGHQGMVVVAVLEAASRSLRAGGREEPVLLPEHPAVQKLNLRLDQIEGDLMPVAETLVASA